MGQILDIKKVLTLSYEHVTSATYQALAYQKPDNFTILPAYQKMAIDCDNRGIYIEIDHGQISWEQIPNDLRPLIELAANNGCDILCLAKDGPTLKEYPTYE